jgi:hypothetical protein
VLQNTVGVLENIVIPETYDLIARNLKPGGSLRIFVDLFSMLTAIQFDDQLRQRTKEIDDI